MNRGGVVRIVALVPLLLGSGRRLLANEVARSLSQDGQRQEIRVDFSQQLPESLAGNGFLNDGPAILAARDSVFAPLLHALGPTFWRIGAPQYLVPASRLGVRTEVVLSGAWRSQVHANWRRPFDDYGQFERWLSSFVAQNSRSVNVWEFWNEPDNLDSWSGSEAQWLEAYARGERVIREQLGARAIVAGPSLGHFDLARLQRFADFCMARGCEINALTWHELQDGSADAISSHVQSIRDSIMDSPRYKDLRIREVQLNEVVSKAERYSTGDLVVVLSNLQRSRVGAFARSCWGEFATAGNDCDNTSLDGIIDPSSARPRGSWWVQAAYAAIRRAPVKLTVPQGFAALAGRAALACFVLVAPSDRVSRPDSLLVRLDNIQDCLRSPQRSEADYRVVVRRIPWQPVEETVDSLPVIGQRVISDSNSVTISVSVPAFSKVSDRAAHILEGSDALMISIEPTTHEPSAYWPVWVRSRSPS